MLTPLPADAPGHLNLRWRRIVGAEMGLLVMTNADSFPFPFPFVRGPFPNISDISPSTCGKQHLYTTTYSLAISLVSMH